MPTVSDRDHFSNQQRLLRIIKQHACTLCGRTNKQTISVSLCKDSVYSHKQVPHGGFSHLHPVNMFMGLPLDIVQPSREGAVGVDHGRLIHPRRTERRPTVTTSWVVVGIDRVMILSLYQSAVCNETKYRRLRLSCCNKLLTISQLPSSS